MSSLDSDSSTTVDTSSSEGEDEKDLILPDYPSEELTSSESSDSEPEDASAENLSTGWSERVTRVDTHFLRDHVGPKTSQTTSTTRAPHFPSSSCSSMPNSGGSCAAKQSCEPSRSSNPSPLHTMPRRRNLHQPGQGPPLAPPQISWQCCPLSRGERARRQQEPHAVHGPFLQLCCALPPAEERTGSPGSGHHHAKPQALPQGTRQEADRTWQLRILVPRRSVCHRLEVCVPLPGRTASPSTS